MLTRYCTGLYVRRPGAPVWKASASTIWVLADAGCTTNTSGGDGGWGRLGGDGGHATREPRSMQKPPLEECTHALRVPSLYRR